MRFRLVKSPDRRPDLPKICTLAQVAEFLEIGIEDLYCRGEMAETVSLDGYTFQVIRDTGKGSGLEQDRAGT